MPETTIIGESTALTLSLVCALLACVWSFAFFLTRYVSRSELQALATRHEEDIRAINTKLDGLILQLLQEK